jgi:DNA repair protein RadC
LKKLILKRKFEENMLYNLANKESLKYLINFANKKKKRKKEYILMLEKKEEVIAGRIYKNWKTRRKTFRQRSCY